MVVEMTGLVWEGQILGGTPGIATPFDMLRARDDRIN